MDPAGRPVLFGPGKFAPQVLDPPLLLEAFALSGVSLDGLRLSAGFTLGDSQGVIGGGGQTRLDGRDRRTQTHNVAILPITGQSDLIIVTGNDRAGPPRRRPPGQLFLTGVQPGSTRLPAALGIQSQIDLWGVGRCGEVAPSQPAQMLSDQVEHPVVHSSGAHPSADRHPSGGSDRLHSTPPTANRTHHHTITDTTDNQPRPTKPLAVPNPLPRS